MADKDDKKEKKEPVVPQPSRSIQNRSDGSLVKELKKNNPELVKALKETGENVESSLLKIVEVEKQAARDAEKERVKNYNDEGKKQERFYKNVSKIIDEQKSKGLSDEAAEKTAYILAEAAEKNSDKQEAIRVKRLKNEETWVGRLVNTIQEKIPQSMGGDKEQEIEEKRERKSFFSGLKNIFKSKKGEDDKNASGFFGKIFGTIKKVFKMVVGKFLLIGAAVAFLISQMNIDQLKEVWKNLKAAFTAIWEFVGPIVKYLWNWIKESVLPNLVDFFINSLKTITEMFKNIKARFEGFGEMTLEEKVKAVFNAIGDLGKGFIDLGANLVKSVLKMFGIDGDATVDKFTKPIKDFFTTFFDFFGKLFTGDWKGALKTLWDGLFGAKEGELGGIVGFIWNEVVKPVFNWVKNLIWGMASKIPGVKKALSWLGIGKKTQTKEEHDAAVAAEKAKKEKEARIDRGEKAYDDIHETISFNKMAGKTRLNEKKLNKLSMGQMKEMRDYMISSGKFEGEEAKEMNKVFDKLIKKKEAADKQSAMVDANQKSLRDAGKFGTRDEYMRSDEYKQLTGGKGKTPKFLKEAYSAHLAGKPMTPPKMKAGEKSIADMSTSELDQIKKDEGFRKGVYLDTKDIKTIGYGFNLERAGSQEALNAANITASLEDLKSGKMKLTEEEASRLMMGEMGHFRNVAKRYVGEETWKNLSSNRQGILTNMAYNMGEGTLSNFKDLKAAIVKGDWKQAQVEMKDSAWSKQVKGRADRLIARMGGEEKSQALNTAQAGYTEATGPGGKPIMVTNVNSTHTNNTKTGDTHNIVEGATSHRAGGQQGGNKTIK